MRPTVAIKIPEVDEMMARAQQKVEAIRQVKQKVGELRPIDEVVFAQNNQSITQSGSTHKMDVPQATLRHLYAITCTSCSRGLRRWFSVQRPWKLFTTQQVARSESLSQVNSILAELHWNKCVTE